MYHFSELVHRRSKWFALQAYIYSVKARNIKQLSERIKQPERFIQQMPAATTYGHQIAAITSLIHLCRRYPGKENQLLSYFRQDPRLMCALNIAIQTTGLVSYWQMGIEFYYYLLYRIFGK